MELEIKTAIEEQFARDILLLIDGKKNITDIKKELGLTYKSVLFNLKKLESKKIIISTQKTKNNNSVIFTINPELKNELKDELGKYKLAREYVEYLKKEEPSMTKKFFEVYKKNRFVNDDLLIKNAETVEEVAFFGSLIPHALECGLIRNRTELTRKGSNLLSDISTGGLKNE